MEVILLERIGRLGAMGDVVKVKDGFGRNFLLPQKKALRATENNKKVFEARRGEIEKDNASRRTEAEKIAKRIEGLSLSLVRQASEDGKLYGSVSVRDVAQLLKDQGHDIERKLININTTVKNTGTYTVKVALHPELVVELALNVVRNESDIQEIVPEELQAPEAEDASDETPEAANDA